MPFRFPPFPANVSQPWRADNGGRPTNVFLHRWATVAAWLPIRPPFWGSRRRSQPDEGVFMLADNLARVAAECGRMASCAGPMPRGQCQSGMDMRLPDD